MRQVNEETDSYDLQRSVQNTGRITAISNGPLKQNKLIISSNFVGSRTATASDQRAVIGFIIRPPTLRRIYRVAQKSKPLPYDQKIVSYRIETCEWDKIYSST